MCAKSTFFLMAYTGYVIPIEAVVGMINLIQYMNADMEKNQIQINLLFNYRDAHCDVRTVM